VTGTAIEGRHTIECKEGGAVWHPLVFVLVLVAEQEDELHRRSHLEFGAACMIANGPR